MRYGREWCPHTATAAEVYGRLSETERRSPWVVVATAHPAKFNEIVEPIIGKPVMVPASLNRLLNLPQHAVDLPPTLEALAARSNDQHWNRPGMDCDRLSALLCSAAAIGSARVSAQGAAPRLAGALGTGRVAAAHQVLVPDGMGGFIHIDHLLLTPAAYWCWILAASPD